MRRKVVAKQLKSISRLRSFLSSQRERLDRALTERPAALIQGGFSYLPYLAHLDAELVGVEGPLIEAEETYQYAQRDVAAHRRRHGQNRDRLFSLQSDVKRLLAGLLPAALEGIAITGATPRGAEALEGQVKLTIFLLREVDQMEPPLIAGVTVNASAFADKLQAGLDKLRASDVALIEAQASVHGSQAIADDAIAEAGRVVSWVTGCAEGLCGLAGYDRCAARVRAR